MKWRFARCFIVLCALLAVPQSAAALGAEGRVQLSGVVLPQISIYVNQQGEIEEIVNNSYEDAQVKALSFEKQNQEVSLTPQITAEYQELKSSHDFKKYGMVYKKPVASAHTPNKTSSFKHYFRLSVLAFK